MTTPPPTGAVGHRSPGERLRAEGLAVADEAIGRAGRSDPVLAGSGGPAGNARLTAWTGLALLALLVVELVTLVDVHQLIDWHVAVGVLLVPFALLKTATTGWRIVRYYTGSRPYRSAGPPPLLLRVLGPVVVAATLGVLGSGVLLILLGEERSRSTLLTVLGQRVDWVSLHQGLFVVFAVVTGLHLLARLVPALTLASARMRRRFPGRPAAVPGRGRRVASLVAVLAFGAVGAALLLPSASSWQHDDDRGRSGPPPPGFSRDR